MRHERPRLVAVMSERLRFVTYNIRKGKGASGRLAHDVTELGRALATCHPDLVLCQEVFHGYEPEVSQSDSLSRHLDLLSYYEPNKHRRVGHHGNATFTRLPVVQSHNHDVSTNRIERRGVLYTRALLGTSRPLHVFNAHLGLNQWQRLTQVRRIADAILERVGSSDPLILAGDFNDWNGKLDSIICDELGMVNAFGHLPQEMINTWHARRPVFNLDRVYVRNLEPVLARRFDGTPWDELSDHLPLFVELEA
jgi:endonuclease/exonuclease/phosphatase family metal-dependent hydrolase